MKVSYWGSDMFTVKENFKKIKYTLKLGSRCWLTCTPMTPDSVHCSYLELVCFGGEKFHFVCNYCLLAFDQGAAAAGLTMHEILLFTRKLLLMISFRMSSYNMYPCCFLSRSASVSCCRHLFQMFPAHLKALKVHSWPVLSWLLVVTFVRHFTFTRSNQVLSWCESVILMVTW